MPGGRMQHAACLGPSSVAAGYLFEKIAGMADVEN